MTPIIFNGMCIGGPLNGKLAASKSPHLESPNNPEQFTYSAPPSDELSSTTYSVHRYRHHNVAGVCFWFGGSLPELMAELSKSAAARGAVDVTASTQTDGQGGMTAEMQDRQAFYELREQLADEIIKSPYVRRSMVGNKHRTRYTATIRLVPLE
jgi:hypothetical protein